MTFYHFSVGFELPNFNSFKHQNMNSIRASQSQEAFDFKELHATKQGKPILDPSTHMAMSPRAARQATCRAVAQKSNKAISVAVGKLLKF